MSAADLVGQGRSRRQNSWPSGSASTIQRTSPWPMSTRVAPRETSRSTSERWSPPAGRGEVEVQPVLPALRCQRRAAPRDLRAAVRRADRGLLVLVPDQRPAQRLRSRSTRPPASPSHETRPDEPAVGEEAVARLDDAELVAFGVGEHDVTLVRPLADVDVPGAELAAPAPPWPVGPRARCSSGRSASGSGRPSAAAVGRNRIRNPVSSAGSSATPSGRRRPSPSPGPRPRSARVAAGRSRRSRARRGRAASAAPLDSLTLRHASAREQFCRSEIRLPPRSRRTAERPRPDGRGT